MKKEIFFLILVIVLLFNCGGRPDRGEGFCDSEENLKSCLKPSFEYGIGYGTATITKIDMRKQENGTYLTYVYCDYENFKHVYKVEVVYDGKIFKWREL